MKYAEYRTMNYIEREVDEEDIIFPCDKCRGTMNIGESYRCAQTGDADYFHGFLFVCFKCTKTHEEAMNYINLMMSLHKL